jgi:phytoene synthase
VAVEYGTLALLDDWSRLLHRAAAGDEHRPAGSDADPTAVAIFLALGQTIRTCHLEVSLFDDLLGAFGRTSPSSGTYGTTWTTAGGPPAIGRLVLRVAGFRDDNRDRWSDAICTALQLTNFWQDLARDWENGRVYVPQSLLRTSGAEDDDLARGTISPEWRMALRAAASKTRELFQTGRPVADSVTGRLRWELRATWLGGMRILDALERNAFDVFRARPALDWRDAGAIAWGTMTWRRHDTQDQFLLCVPGCLPQRRPLLRCSICGPLTTVSISNLTKRAGRRWSGGGPRSRGFGRAPETARAAVCSRSSAVPSAARTIRGAHRGRGDGSAPRRYQFLRARALLPRVASSVGLMRCDRRDQDPSALTYARDLASRSSSRTSCAMSVWTTSAALLSAAGRLGLAAPRRTWRARRPGGAGIGGRVRTLLDHQPRARVFFARLERCPTGGHDSRGRDHARHLLGSLAGQARHFDVFPASSASRNPPRPARAENLVVLRNEL